MPWGVGKVQLESGQLGLELMSLWFIYSSGTVKGLGIQSWIDKDSGFKVPCGGD